MRMSRLTILIVFWAVLIHRLVRAADDPLPSWNDGAVKTTCLPSSSHVTKVDGSDFIPAAERIPSSITTVRSGRNIRLLPGTVVAELGGARAAASRVEDEAAVQRTA